MEEEKRRRRKEGKVESGRKNKTIKIIRSRSQGGRKEGDKIGIKIGQYRCIESESQTKGG